MAATLVRSRAAEHELLGFRHHSAASEISELASSDRLYGAGTDCTFGDFPRQLSLRTTHIFIGAVLQIDPTLGMQARQP